MALTKIKTQSINDDAITTAKINNNAVTDAKVADDITAGTAATLATARSINGVSFNGSSAITVTAAAGTLTGNTLASGVTASSLTSLGTLSSLNTSGNIGLGVTPDTWHSSYDALQGANFSLSTDAVAGASKAVTLAYNQYIDSGNAWTYINADEASYYQQYNGDHYFATADAGSADGDVTNNTRLTIKNGGFIGIGTTSPSEILHLNSATAGGDTSIRLDHSNSGRGNFYLRSKNSGNQNWFVIGEETDGDFFTIMSDNDGSGGGAGRVGIGDISPDTKLHINDSGVDKDVMMIEGAIGADEDWLGIGFRSSARRYARIAGGSHTYAPDYGMIKFEVSDSADTLVEKMRIEGNTGNIGIGTSSPGAPLDVQASANGSKTLAYFLNTSQTNDAAQIRVGSGTANKNNMVIGFETVGDDNAGNYGYIGMNSVGNAIFIDNDAYVGIGTPSPSTLFHVKGNYAVTAIIENDSDDASLKLDGKDQALYLTNYGSDKWKIYSTNDADKTFFIRNETHSSTAMSITNASSNNVTFGGTGHFSGRVTGQMESGNDRGYSRLSVGNGWSMVELGEVSGAYWGMGPHSPGSYGLTSECQFAYNNGSSWTAGIFQIATGGNITGTHGSYHTSSDETLKKNISTISSGLDKVNAMRGVQFKWKKEHDPHPEGETNHQRVNLGFIAQELEDIVPEVVNTNSDTGLKSVLDANQLTAVLVEAIKELSDKLDTANAKITALENA